MKIGRNDPCPCGSGKKYKACCLALDEGAGATSARPGETRSVARAAEAWEVDRLAVPVEIRSDPDGRPSVPLVVASDFVLDAEFLSRPGNELDQVAADLASAVERAAKRIGGFPKTLRVRHAELVVPLGERLARHGVRIERQRSLPGLERAAASLLEHAAGRPGLGRVVMTRTWRAWGHTDDWIRRLHHAAATFFLARPWVALTNLDLLFAKTPAGQQWVVGVLGNNQREFGLVLYSDLSDFARLAQGEMEAFEGALQGRYLSLTFDAASDLPKEQRREAARAGWEVAAAEAYPVLIVANSVGAGFSAADAEDLVAAFELVPRYLDAEPPEGETWVDPATGWRVEERRHDDRHEPTVGARSLAPGCSSGLGSRPDGALEAASLLAADPDAFLAVERAVVERFEAALAERDLSKATVARHVDRAATFVDFLAGDSGVPVAAVHEYDLRSFLHDWSLRKVVTSVADSRAMPGSLSRFFGFLAEREQIVCPWADAILADKATYERRRKSCPGHFLWDERVAVWIAELTEELDARLFLPDSGLAGDEEWGELMGVIEAELHFELSRRWLLWRDELLAAGPPLRLGRLRAALVTRQRAWEESRHPALDGGTPVEAILDERELSRR